ncbi:hypothetical protein [Aquabacterium sp. OR-4]|uniref:hypothetical protein n=1 Tax=Aquabacterium sp. OR-4 TaxID=2978127 RepID=UPI0021B1690B|nr:hypothetical protein [Aquabacterium sp. OR-4]MDT7836495.1 hypothetical protein [Aquabacterium sp. OR-4]
MEMMNRAIDGAALFKDMMQKVEAGAVPAAPADPEVAAWNAEVDRARAEKLERRMKASDSALRAELAKASQR